MAKTYSGELSEQAKRALAHLFPLIDHWRQRMESAPTMGTGLSGVLYWCTAGDHPQIAAT
jgi:hypothetical protein